LSIDKTAERIIHAFSNLPPGVGMVFEDGQSIDLVELVPMAKLWLMKERLLIALNGVKNVGFTTRYGIDLLALLKEIEALGDNDE